MRLYVMRHGPAEDRAPSGRDADRALTTEGRARVERVAAELRAVHAAAPLGAPGRLAPPSAPNPRPRVLASPLRRARETAEIVAGALLGGADDIELHDDLSLDADPPIALASRLGKDGADALLIGHQPNVEELVRALATAAPGRGHAPLRGGFCTAMGVILELAAADPLRPERRWDVRSIIDPRLLR
ncbi:MAG: histidine phosphatase family protein [Polyangiaceae bacterium]|nr:histidine phosphatase family protein [Polyangiaceae bacterium]